jgi:hypothetical protein
MLLCSLLTRAEFVVKRLTLSPFVPITIPVMALAGGATDKPLSSTYRRIES